MKAQSLNRKITYQVLRFIVLASLLILILDFAFPSKFYDFVRRVGLFDAWFIWYIVSPLILIILNGFVIWCMQGKEMVRRPLIVNWLLVVAYVCVWSFSLLYPITLH